jgi:hypothetical protein
MEKKNKKNNKYIDFDPETKGTNQFFAVMEEFIDSASDEILESLDESDYFEFIKMMPEEYKEYSEEIFESFNSTELNEHIKPLTYEQRIRRAMIMRKYASKMKMARERLRNRRASNDKLKARARKRAIEFLRARILKNRKYADLSSSEKIALDTRLARISDAVIARIAQKQLPKVQRAETDRIKALHSNITKTYESVNVKSFMKLIEKRINASDPRNRKDASKEMASIYKFVTPGEKTKDKIVFENVLVPSDLDTLDISRLNMPQINDYDHFTKWARDNGIKCEKCLKDTNMLTATQGNFDKSKIESMIDNFGKKIKPIIVSKDNYILDGHHRWLAATNQMIPFIQTYVIDLPVEEAMGAMFQYPNVDTGE